jgi:EmrB/QacA subfamily drug resistance transporter
MEADARPVRRGLAVPAILVGMFLVALDNTILGAAMPTAVMELGGLSLYHWTFSVYMLFTTALAPLAGRLCDLYGRRRFFLAGVAAFMAASAWAGAAGSMAELIAARAAQGIGAGTMLPSGLALLASLFPAERRGAAMGLLSAVWGFASVVGPAVGGTLAQAGHWRWCFWVNLPSGLVAGALLLASRAGAGGNGAGRAPDVAGAALVVLASGALFAGLGLARDGWTSPAALAAFGASVALTGLLAWRTRTAPDPFVRVGLFRRPAFAPSVSAGFLGSIAMFASIVFLPLYVQGVLGGTPREAGMVLTPFSLSWSVMAALSGPMLARIGLRLPVVAGGAAMAAAYAGLLAWGGGAGWWGVAGLAALVGAGLGLVMTSTVVAVQNAVPDGELGSATSANQFVRNVGAMMGVAVLGSVVVALLRSGGVDDAEARKLLDPLERASAAPARLEELRGTLSGALTAVFWTGLAAAAATAAVGLVIPGRQDRQP